MTRVTLTFDNGPSLETTPIVLDELARRNLQAYFCIVGRQLKKGPEFRDLALAARDAGHLLVNHSHTHGTALGDDASAAHARHEIDDMDQLMTETLGSWGEPWFRPFGRGGEIGPHLFSQPAVASLQSCGYSVLLWNCVPRDWEDPVGWVNTALEQMQGHDHSVVVLHDLPTGAMQALPMFLDELEQRHCEFTLDLPEDCVPMRQGQPAWSDSQFSALVTASL